MAYCFSSNRFTVFRTDNISPINENIYGVKTYSIINGIDCELCNISSRRSGNNDRLLNIILVNTEFNPASGIERIIEGIKHYKEKRQNG